MKPLAKKQKRDPSDEAHSRPPINAFMLGRGHRVSAAAKEAILNNLKALRYIPEDVATSTRTMRRLRNDAASRNTNFGPLIITRTFTTTGGDKDYPLQNPLAMLYIAMQSGPRFAAYVREALRIHGPPSFENPWSIVIYVDEVTCGNALAIRADSRRKVQGLYWSVYQLGSRALADDSCWFELAAFRTSETDCFEGTITHLLDVALTCFFDPAGANARTGILCDLRDHGPFMVCLQFEMLIADVKALCEAIGSLGVSAHLPCWYCRKVLSFRALQDPVIKALPGFVDLSCADPSKWGKHTDASFTKQLDDLEAAYGTADYKRKCTLAGYKHLPNNFLRNSLITGGVELLSLICLDWMHLFFQTGNWNREAFQVMYFATTRTCHAYALFQAYANAFDFPHRQKCVLSLLTDAHWDSCKAAAVFKCTASDGLTLYALLGKFFEKVLVPRHHGTAIYAKLCLMVRSYQCLSDVVDVLQVSKFGREVDPALLDGTIGDWRDAHFKAYGKTLTYLKTHLTSHLPENMRARSKKSKSTLTLACWTLERSCVYIYIYMQLQPNACMHMKLHCMHYRVATCI